MEGWIPLPFVVMSNVNLLYYEILHYQPENVELMRHHFDVHIVPTPDDDTPENLKKVHVAIAPLGFYWGMEKIEAAPDLKVIASNTTGTPHIDVEYAEQRGIKVVSLKGETEFLSDITPTAELTWALILGVVRRIPWAFRGVCEGGWDRRSFGAKSMLSRMALGVVGLGRLGKMVARQALSFGMSVRYYDPSEQLSEGEVEKAPSLEDLVAQSDIVTVHIPLERQNERIFNKDIFYRFKDGAYFINTSRGEIVDSQALLNALKTKKLAGAALDVLDGEFDRGFCDRVVEHPLVEYASAHDNLLITPHIGGSTVDAWRMTERFTIELVLKALTEI